jgi:(R,R)-butanediol dehydrogenase / meso-butanediol dehydrogenase / diacetyl reductase
VQKAVDYARRGGVVCLIGVADTDATITPAMWVVKEISLVAALAYTHEEFEMAMGMIADGRVRLEPMHSATIGLGDLGDMLGSLADGTSGQTKVLVDPRL